MEQLPIFLYIYLCVEDLFPTEVVNKVKPNINSVEVHPQLQRMFLEKNPQIHHISSVKQMLSLPYLDYRSLQVTIHTKVSEEKISCLLTCSQIWLSPLVEDRQSIYLMKLKNKRRPHDHDSHLNVKGLYFKCLNILFPKKSIIKVLD